MKIKSSNPVIIPTGIKESIPPNCKVSVLTGSGISAESGIPTFREAQVGLWEKHNPEDLATPKAFSTNPRLVWDWYLWRRKLIIQANPNDGHLALAALEKNFNQSDRNFVLITQNVDGLHQKAGSKNVIELHGNILREICFQCRKSPKIALSLTPDGEIPTCPYCGGLYRPDVVWFGEQLPHPALELAIKAAEDSDIFLSVGTSALVQPAASLPFIAKQNKALLIEVNITQTPLTPFVDCILIGSSSKILPDLIQSIWGINHHMNDHMEEI